MPILRRILLQVVAIFVCAFLAQPLTSAQPLSDEEALGKVVHASNRSLALDGNYLVVLNETLLDNRTSIVETIGAFLNVAGDDGEDEDVAIEKGFDNLRMAHISLRQFNQGEDLNLRSRRLLRLLRNPEVVLIEEDSLFETQQNEDDHEASNADQPCPPWGLDRIDQTDLPLNDIYHSDVNGAGVVAYVIDTGIRASHSDFEGRASCPVSFVRGQDCTDGNGHGTHVGGTIGGASYGVAKGVELVGVKVLSNEGSGSNSGILGGLDWIIGQAQQDPNTPRVANLSLGGLYSSVLNQAVTTMVVRGRVFTAVAAGNSDVNACIASPAGADVPITVGATDVNDRRASFSNKGGCVEIFAPGVDITSAWYNSDAGVNTISGTSMACPHVAGVGALYLQVNPTARPGSIKGQILNDATANKIVDLEDNSPNLLLNTEALFATQPGNATDFECSAAFPTTFGLVVSLLALVVALV